MEAVLRSFYEHQGRNERIKKFPLPRQYANMSRYFVGIFITLLPFSMIPVLMQSGTLETWMAVPDKSFDWLCLCNDGSYRRLFRKPLPRLNERRANVVDL